MDTLAFKAKILLRGVKSQLAPIIEINLDAALEELGFSYA